MSDTEKSSRRSRLVDLPFEIRTMVWEYLFINELHIYVRRGTCDDCKTKYHEAPTPSCFLPEDHATIKYPIRETCRQIKNEAERVWLKQSTFTFLDTAFCSFVFRERLPSLLSGLKRLKLYVSNLRAIDESAPRKGSALLAVQMLPGLNLDILTVICTANLHTERLNDVDELIREGMGWRNLRVILYETNPLQFDKARDSGSPWDWHQVIRQRDGMTSNAEVTIYGATEAYEFLRNDGVCTCTVLSRHSPRASAYDKDYSLLIDAKRSSDAQTLYAPQSPVPRWADYVVY